MCSDPRPSPPATWREGLRNFLSNWDQPLPWHVKLAKAVRNFWIRATTPALCCGHAGEPGC
jgi:hypothetical protein